MLKSNIEDSLSPKKYMLAIFSWLVVFSCTLLFIALYFGPAQGGLTRTGGYSESAFGPLEKISGFSKTYTKTVSLEALLTSQTKPEILIFGDSFTLPRKGNYVWTDYLYAEYGFPVYRIGLEGDLSKALTYFQSKKYLTQPPKLIIIETVERYALERIHSIYDENSECLPPKPAQAVVPSKKSRRPQQWEYGTTYKSLYEIFDRAALIVRTRLLGQSTVLNLPLKNEDLFTNKESWQTLIFREDVTNHLGHAPTNVKEDSGRYICGLRRLLTAAGDRAKSFFTIAPDKRTLYEPYFTDALPNKKINYFSLAREALGTRYIDLLAPLQGAIQRGAQDIYLPNDTHWGHRGHTVAGNAVTEALSNAK